MEYFQNYAFLNVYVPVEFLFLSVVLLFGWVPIVGVLFFNQENNRKKRQELNKYKRYMNYTGLQADFEKETTQLVISHLKEVNQGSNVWTENIRELRKNALEELLSFFQEESPFYLEFEEEDEPENGIFAENGEVPVSVEVENLENEEMVLEIEFEPIPMKKVG